MAEGSLVMPYVEGAQAETEAVSVPDVTGLSVVEANRLLRSYGLSNDLYRAAGWPSRRYPLREKWPRPPHRCGWNFNRHKTQQGVFL